MIRWGSAILPLGATPWAVAGCSGVLATGDQKSISAAEATDAGASPGAPASPEWAAEMPPIAAPFDAGSCAVGFADCNGNAADGCETDIRTSSDCGRCHRSCLGQECVDGDCKPQTLQSTIDTPTGFDIDSSNLYYIADGDVYRCPLTGCAGGRSTIAGGFAVAHDLVAAGGSVAFLAGPMYQNAYVCPTTGCTDASTPFGLGHGGGAVTESGDSIDFMVTPSSSSAVLRCADVDAGVCGSTFDDSYGFLPRLQPPIADDGSYVYFGISDQTGSRLARCPVGQSCAPPEAPLPVMSGTPPTLLAVHGGQLYMNGPPTASGDLYMCPAANCETPTSMNASLDSASPTRGIVADSSGVYFSAGDRIYSCPLSGCDATGPRVLARNQRSPGIVRTDDSNVYWVNQGIPSDASTAFESESAEIVRVPK